PLQINVTAEDKSKTYGMDDPELTYIFVPQLIGDDTFSGQLEREKGENIGAYTISKGTLSLNGNYAVSFSEGTFTIQDAVYTGIRFDNASFVYDGTEKSLAITGNLPEGSTITYENNSRTDVGDQEVTATITGANYQTLIL